MPRDVVVRSSDGKTIDVVKEEAEQAEKNAGAKKIVGSSEFLIQQLAYTSQGLVEYIGLAVPGTATNASSWQIRKMNYSGTNVVSILFANGSLAFNQIWDNRGSLSYS